MTFKLDQNKFILRLNFHSDLANILQFPELSIKEYILINYSTQKKRKRKQSNKNGNRK